MKLSLCSNIHIPRLISGLPPSCYKAVNIRQIGNSITIHQGMRYDEVSNFHVMRFSQKNMKQSILLETSTEIQGQDVYAASCGVLYEIS